MQEEEEEEEDEADQETITPQVGSPRGATRLTNAKPLAGPAKQVPMH